MHPNNNNKDHHIYTKDNLGSQPSLT